MGVKFYYFMGIKLENKIEEKISCFKYLKCINFELHSPHIRLVSTFKVIVITFKVELHSPHIRLVITFKVVLADHSSIDGELHFMTGHCLLDVNRNYNCWCQ